MRAAVTARVPSTITAMNCPDAGLSFPFRHLPVSKRTGLQLPTMLVARLKYQKVLHQLPSQQHVKLDIQTLFDQCAAIISPASYDPWFRITLAAFPGKARTIRQLPVCLALSPRCQNKHWNIGIDAGDIIHVSSA